MPARRRIHVNFTEQSYRVLEDVASRTGNSMTVVLSDAVVLYRWFTEVRAQGNRIFVETPNGSTRELISL